MKTHILHFDLAQSHLRTQASQLNLWVGEYNIPLQEHDESSLARAAGENPAIDMVLRYGSHNISHFAEVPEHYFLPHHVTLIKVVGDKSGPYRSSLPVLYHLSYHIPNAHLHRYVKRNREKLAVNNVEMALPGKLSALGVNSQHLARNSIHCGDLWVATNEMKTPWDVACSIVFSHPELSNSQAYAASIVMNAHIAPPEAIDPLQYNRVYELAISISSQGPATDTGGFATYGQLVDPDGNAMFYEFDWVGQDGQVIFAEGDPVMQYNLSDETENYSGSPASNALKTSHNDGRLQNHNWSVSQSASLDVAEFKDQAAALAVKRDTNQIWTATNRTPNHGMDVYADSIRYDSSQSHFSIDFKNNYLRQLGVYIQFFKDTKMEQPIDNPKVDGDWPFYFPQELAALFETPSQKALGVLANVNTIMGIPMPTDPTNFGLPWPAEAQAAKFLFGGLGTSRWENPIVWPGVILTGMFQYGIPALMMLAGAMVTNSQWYKDFISNKDNVAILAGIAFPLIGGGAAVGSALFNTKKVLTSLASIAIGILAKKGMEALATYVTAQVAASAAAQAVPVVGWAFRLAAITLDVAQIAVTTGELLSSPATLEVDIKRQMTLAFTLHPDPAHGEAGRPETAIWPPVAVQCQVTVEYTNGTYYTQTIPLPATGSNTPLSFNFNLVGWGGTLKIKANVYSATGWLAGSYTSDLLNAQPDDPNEGIMRVSGNIKEMLVPLTQVTQYEYWEQLSYDSGKKEYQWIEGSVPLETQSSTNCSNVGNNICKLVNMTILNSDYQVGYCYQASGQDIPLEDPLSPPNSGQMYVLQNISTLSNDSLNERLKLSAVGFKVQPLISYNSFGEGPDEKTITPYNFIIDSRFGEYHLRRVDLRDGSHNFGLTDNPLSWGTFTIPHLDAMVVHPSGYVIAVSWQYSKMQILALGDQGYPDAQAPAAQIVSGEGVRQGLTHGPIALTVTPDGRILLLETINTRIQAFDTKGNPFPSFAGATLFQLTTADYRATLDAQEFSPALQQAFREQGLTFLFSNSDPNFIRSLNAGVLDEQIIAAFAEDGIYLSYNQTADGNIDPVGSTVVNVIQQGQSWSVYDPQKPATYTLTAKGQTVSVYNDLSNVRVIAIGQGVKWQIDDLSGARSWLLTLNVTNPAQITVADYLSYMPLNKPAGITYLDVAVESKGYIYVLSYRNEGRDPTDYVLDIYNPDGTFLVTVPDSTLVPDPAKRQHIVAAHLAIDSFRTLVAMNYGKFLGENQRTQPQISQWKPTTPIFDLGIDQLTIFQQHDMDKIHAVFAGNKHPLSNKATIETINENGYFIITDVNTRYPVICTVDGDNQQIISVYSFSETTMPLKNYSSGFKEVLQLLGIPESDVTEKVVVASSSQGSLRPDDPQSLAPSYTAEVSSAAELLTLSGIPPVEAPISFPATVDVFAIAELEIADDGVLNISNPTSRPIVVVVDTLALKQGGQLICDAAVILNVQTYTKTQENSHE
ncbi:hypothetical protein [Xenorhabdus griffiniae]|uniref:NHL repeat containing protein n=1 Tax=Xenorhabdus griffiniae TaxID=351672 RepID=A0ABY9XEZ5_9GAMM|nr:hypothetical protein [Xenorhabdus griffiniae]MBD1228223.1 hypothetical protein [Xenorhabdus griffiniae]MBE8587821.1 hypothetical protein [Xenorhabdus griffiniae]WMV71490.1 hypothetical protein QL128_15195 [Xenorhabdus griffiniae]WNH01167.1 hypothetical protein QL112_015200 [Xenorhabdus griffiniae]